MKSYVKTKKIFIPLFIMDYQSAKIYVIDRLKNELPDNLHYHGLHHTYDVISTTEMYAYSEGIEGDDFIMLKTGALYHDIGFIVQYKGHEEVGAQIAEKTLKGFEYTDEQIKIIADMIRATNLNIEPKNILEQILCDADLDYLGRDDFPIRSQTLKIEFYEQGFITDEKSWETIQYGFITKHKYYTNTAKKIREPRKQKYLKDLKKLLEKYSI